MSEKFQTRASLDEARALWKNAYDNQTRKIIVCGGTGCVAGGSLNIYDTLKKLLEKNGIQIPLHHCSNSAGIIRVPEANLNIVRAGITIYGIYPSEEVERDIVKLSPVLELKSHITYVKDVLPGTAISCGGTYVADRKLRVATVPVGYADGYPRRLSNNTTVTINGVRYPQAGRICMDMCMVLADKDKVKRGDEVTLIGGNSISWEDAAQKVGTINYELTCLVTNRVPRVYINED